jgi:hypothetical protein
LRAGFIRRRLDQRRDRQRDCEHVAGSRHNAETLLVDPVDGDL